MTALRAAIFLVPLVVAALVRWWLARKGVRHSQRWLLWLPVAGSAVVAVRSQLPPGRRAGVLLAATAAVYLTAALCAFILFVTVGESTGQARYVIDAAQPGGAAEGRLAPGDRLLALDGAPLRVDDVPPLSQRIDASGGRPVTFTVLREGREVSVEVTPRLDDRGAYRIGVELKLEDVFERRGVGAALAGAIKAPAEASARFIAGWWQTLTGGPGDEVFTGPVGIARALAQVADDRKALHTSLADSVWFLTWAVLADLVLLLVIAVIALRRRRGAVAAR